MALIASSAAKAEEPSLQSGLSKAISGVKDDGFLTFNFENDMIGGGADRNYTSGVRLTYFNLGATLPDFANTIDKLIPTFTINKTTSIYYSVGQNLYTPADTTKKTQDINDRPWAALLYASAGLTSVTANHIDNVETTLGVIGPAAMGEETQKFVHKYISHSPEPQGWSHQLKNEPAFMLSWERSWSERYGFQALGWTGAFVPHIGATIGNVYTYANTGISLHLSPNAGKWQDDPIRVRPAQPGTGAFIVPDHTFSWYFFGGLEGRAVARNIFLDGNSFTQSYSVDKKPLVMDANGGIALTYGKTRLSYSLIYRTKEFYKQNGGDLFGSIGLGYRF
jgi:hypothetical protein